MRSVSTTSWQEANRRDLGLRIQRLRLLLEQALNPDQEPVSVAPVPLDPGFALPRLAILFGCHHLRQIYSSCVPLLS